MLCIAKGGINCRLFRFDPFLQTDSQTNDGQTNLQSTNESITKQALIVFYQTISSLITKKEERDWIKRAICDTDLCDLRSYFFFVFSF